MKKIKLVILAMSSSLILLGCSNNKLEGTWQEFNDTRMGEEIIFTKNEVTADDTVLTYRISENKKYLVIGSGGLEESVSYELSSDRLTIDDDVYYRKDSKSYKEQDSKMKKNAEITKQKQKKEQEEKEKWKKQVQSTKGDYTKALEQANGRLLGQLLIKIDGNWVYLIDELKYQSVNYKKIEYSFDKAGKLSYKYHSKTGLSSSINETTEEGSGIVQFNYEGNLYLDLSENSYGSNSYNLEEKNEKSEKELTLIKENATKLNELTLDSYLEELKQKREGNTFTTDYLTVTVDDNTGDFTNKNLILNFPESEPSILQISTSGSFKDYKKE